MEFQRLIRHRLFPVLSLFYSHSLSRNSSAGSSEYFSQGQSVEERFYWIILVLAQSSKGTFTSVKERTGLDDDRWSTLIVYRSSDRSDGQTLKSGICIVRGFVISWYRSPFTVHLNIGVKYCLWVNTINIIGINESCIFVLIENTIKMFLNSISCVVIRRENPTAQTSNYRNY